MTKTKHNIKKNVLHTRVRVFWDFLRMCGLFRLHFQASGPFYFCQEHPVQIFKMPAWIDLSRFLWLDEFSSFSYSFYLVIFETMCSR